MLRLAGQIDAKIVDKDKAKVEWLGCEAECVSLNPMTLDLCKLFQGPNFLSDLKIALKNVFAKLAE